MLKLTVVTPEKRLVTDVEVDDILLPAFRGELNILDGHAPLMTTLTPGVVQFKRKNSTTTELIAVSWGYCEVANNIVNILAETAERPEEIDVSRAEQGLKQSEVEMGTHTDPEMIEESRLRREKALVRISVARIDH